MSLLKVEWCTYAAAKHAVLNWHYSRRMPVGKLVMVGAWESGRFVGVVIFGLGAAAKLGKPYGVSRFEVCELVRVALREHKAPVSQIVAHALRFLKCKCPKIRVVVSFADPARGHHGGIYQAGNWIYLGKTSPDVAYRIGSRIVHNRNFSGGQFGRPKRKLPRNAIKVRTIGKHRYAFGLDHEMRELLRTMAQLFPKAGEA